MLHKLWYFWYVIGVKLDIFTFLKLVWYCLKDSINVDFVIFSVLVYFQFKQRARRRKCHRKILMKKHKSYMKSLYFYNYMHLKNKWLKSCKIHLWLLEISDILIYILKYKDIFYFLYCGSYWCERRGHYGKNPMNNFTRSCETHSSWNSNVKTNDIKIFY